MVNKILTVLILFCAGCVSANIPNYLKEEHPYKKKIYADYQKTVAATQEALKELGWTIAETTQPGVYEQEPSANSQYQATLLFTNIRQTALFLGTRYAKMNIYLRELADGTELEIRYLTVTSTPLRSFESYRNDSAVQKFFERIDQQLN